MTSLLKCFRYIGQNRQMTCPLDGGCEHPLMMSATPGNPAGDYLATLGNETTQQPLITVINLCDRVFTEPTMPFSSFIHNFLPFSRILSIWLIINPYRNLELFPGFIRFGDLWFTWLGDL
jgi:hypothetical protein